jgi:hypothetical protein
VIVQLKKGLKAEAVEALAQEGIDRGLRSVL